MQIDLATEPLGTGSDGNPVYLKDIWPSSAEIAEFIRANVTRELFRTRYADVFKGDENWAKIKSGTSMTYGWESGSTYVQNPPYFDGITMTPEPVTDIVSARVLGLFLDSITTDHISPAGSIKDTSPAGQWLIRHGVIKADFNSYGARRGNHEVMMRGTFANVRIKNLMIPSKADGSRVEGGLTIHQPSGEQMSIYDAAVKYQAEGTPLMVLAGAEYGTGSSRDWAAKGTNLLGVKAVVAASFERIHRSNLIGMGVLPCQFEEGTNPETLGLDGSETFDLVGIGDDLKPRQKATLRIHTGSSSTDVAVIVRIDTAIEVDYYRHGGILQYVLRQLMA